MSTTNTGVEPGTPQRIVAGVDGSPSSLDAVRWAAREAARTGLALRLTHVCDLPPLNPHIAASPPPSYGAVWAESGRRWLREAEAVAGEAAPGVDVDWDVYLGAAAATLVEESGAANLVVVGSRGFGGFRRLFAGSVAVTVAAHAACPIVVVRAGTVAADVGPVVVGADGSPLSEQALALALEAAFAREARLIAVRAWRDPWAGSAWSGLPLRCETDDVSQQENRALHADLAAWRGKYPDVEVSELVVRAERPADALLEAAAHAQLLVVGSHGRDVLSGALLGSTSQALLHAAPCPVAIVRPGHAS